MIHVVHVVFSLGSGGAENGIVNLANHLDPRHFSTSIVCLDERGGLAERLRGGISVATLGRKSGFSWRSAAQLGAELRGLSGQTAIVHTHNLGPLIYSELAKVTNRLHLPILHGEHAELHGEELSFKRRLQRRIFFRAAKKLHTVSQSVKTQLVALGTDPGRIAVILNGVDCQRFRPPSNRAEAKSANALPPDAFVLGYVARFAPTKRHLLLLEAFEQLGLQVPHLHLLLGGDGGSAKPMILDAMARHPFKERIHWKGYQSHPELLYQAMDLFVMPSEREGLANVLLECMASGVPPVAHDACGAREVIDHGRNGVILCMSNSGVLSRCLAELIPAAGRLAAMSQGARATAERDFSLNAMMEGYTELYRSLVNG